MLQNAPQQTLLFERHCIYYQTQSKISCFGNYLIFSKLPNLIFNRLSSGFSTKWNFVNTLDVWSYRIISLGNIALTLGILAGSVWANESWGSYWSWDPKETWSLITWLVFTMYLHGRLINNWKGVKVAIIAVTGFISIWISYFGVNFLANGFYIWNSLKGGCNSVSK